LQGTVGIYFLGTAGCGKSTLTAAAADWLARNGYTVQTVNLDPGADILPYEPGVDVRDWITLGDVMEEYGLGPNGAQVVAADMMALYKKRIVDDLSLGQTQYVLFDTPGQLELFSFREASRELVHGLLPDTSFLVYLIDPFNARTPSGYVSQVMLSNLSKLRFHVPSLEVISKSDMVSPDLMVHLDRWQEYPDNLMDELLLETSGGRSMAPELSIGLFRAMDDLALFSNHVKVSAKNGTGLESIYQTVQLVYGGGEDLEEGTSGE